MTSTKFLSFLVIYTQRNYNRFSKLTNQVKLLFDVSPFCSLHAVAFSHHRSGIGDKVSSVSLEDAKEVSRCRTSFKTFQFQTFFLVKYSEVPM